MDTGGRRFSIAHLALTVPWVAIVIDAWQPIKDNSFLWHVRAGELQLREGSVLTEDPFSFTMRGSEWITQSWLVELLYAWGEDLLGIGFVAPMLLAVSTVTFLGIALIAYRHSKSVTATAFVMVLSTFALISFLGPRPVLFSFLLMVLVILAWHRPGSHWAVPFLMWIWASVHASFLIGLAYMGLSIIMQKNWRSLRFVVPAGVATLLTAHGLGVAEFLIDFTENRDALELLSEWRKPELLSAVFLPFLGGISFIVIGAFRQRIHPRHLWLLVPFTALAMTSVRAIPPSWLAIVPLVAIALGEVEIGQHRGLRPQLAAVFVVVVVVLPFFLVSPSRIDEERFPTEAIDHLADVPTFHDDRVGGYLIWAAGPERKVYIDDRAELYGDRMAEFVKVREGELEWRTVFRRDGIDQALLANEEELIGELRNSDWDLVYRDDNFSVLRPEAAR